MTEETAALRQSYEVVSVQRADPPPGTEGSDWHRYVIAFDGSESIHGVRQGSLRFVTGAVKDIVEQLNARHAGKYGRVHLVPKPKKVPASNDRSN
jgi:hypothetical protein